MLFICVGFETISSDNNLKMSLLEKALLNGKAARVGLHDVTLHLVRPRTSLEHKKEC